MRTFSTAVSQALSQDYVEYFFLIDLELNANYYMTTHAEDITENGHVYTANGAIFNYDPPKQNSIVNRDAYKIAFIDPNNQLFLESKAGIVGKTVKIRAGFVHETLGPLTDPVDLVYVYSGYVDAPSVSNDFETKILSIECSSPMADLDAVKPFFTTKYGIAQYNTGDTCFDRIHDGYSLQLKWGKT